MMEESDAGFTLCHRLKRRFSECPIVMVSGVVSDARMAFDHHGPGGAWMKVDGFLPKPVRIEQLRRELCRLLDGDGAAVAKERR
jgi:CheY-like chemotaxis protein